MYQQEEQSLLLIFRRLGGLERKAVIHVAGNLLPDRPKLRLVASARTIAASLIDASDVDDESADCFVDSGT